MGEGDSGTMACLVCGAALAPVLARLAAVLCHDCRELGESAWTAAAVAPSAPPPSAPPPEA